MPNIVNLNFRKPCKLKLRTNERNILVKTARVITKSLFFVCFTIFFAVFGSIIYLESSISDEFKIKKGDTLNIDSPLPVTAVFEGSELSQRSTNAEVGDEFDVELKAFGIIPFSTVSVEVVDELHVAVLGTPFGMKLYTEGVLVIDVTEVKTANGSVKPAAEGGIKKGDYILTANGEEISNNEELSEVVEASGGEDIKFVIKRDGKKKTLSFPAAYCTETEKYKIGIWIRDSSAGIGTLTFYSPATGIISGLGHGICDEDTGSVLQLNSGEIVNAKILSVEKGSVGSPGQLNGKFGNKTIGEICLNCSGGVYSKPIGSIDTSYLLEIALKQEIQNGEAQIYCTVDGETPELFDCLITLRSSAYLADTQNMIITVTDEKLLNTTGGIVQGMSGSPIIQNGKLIGAMTHVLVDDPTKGYGIFAENMLENAQSVTEENLKEAS